MEPEQPTSASKPEAPESEQFEERRNLVQLDAWKAEFALVTWRKLLPFRNWRKDKPWNLVWVQFLLFAFGAPFVLISYYGEKSPSLVEAAWALSLYFSIIWAVLLHRCLRPQEIGFRRIASTWLLTSIVGVAAVGVVNAAGAYIPGIRDLFEASSSASIVGRLVGMTFAVGLIEESAKMIPVLLIARKMQPQPHPRTVAYLGVISGLAFGATEAIVYSISYAYGHSTHRIGYGDYLIVQIIRFISLPLLHAIWAGITGYFVGLSIFSPVARRVLLAAALMLTSSLHGIYNTCGSGWFAFAMAIISLGLFVNYVRNDADSIEALPQNHGGAR